jgi:hypothetical protein
MSLHEKIVKKLLLSLIEAIVVKSGLLEDVVVKLLECWLKNPCAFLKQFRKNSKSLLEAVAEKFEKLT